MLAISFVLKGGYSALRSTMSRRMLGGSFRLLAFSVANRPSIPSSSKCPIKTQRMGTAGKPVEYHTAVSEAISTVRSSLPYQSAILVGFQTVLGSSATAERLG